MSKFSTKRPFILPRDGYEFRQEVSPTLQATLENKGIITVCADISFDNGKTFHRIGKIFSIEEIGQSRDSIHSIRFDAPDDTLVEAVTRKTGCRYTL